MKALLLAHGHPLYDRIWSDQPPLFSLMLKAWMDAFRAGLLVPPEMAVFAEKRLETGFLTQEAVLGVITEYQPEQILLGRFELGRVEDALAGRYELVLRGSAGDLFIREDLVFPISAALIHYGPYVSKRMQPSSRTETSL